MYLSSILFYVPNSYRNNVVMISCVCIPKWPIRIFPASLWLVHFIVLASFNCCSREMLNGQCVYEISHWLSWWNFTWDRHIHPMIPRHLIVLLFHETRTKNLIIISNDRLEATEQGPLHHFELCCGFNNTIGTWNIWNYFLYSRATMFVNSGYFCSVNTLPIVSDIFNELHTRNGFSNRTRTVVAWLICNLF